MLLPIRTCVFDLGEHHITSQTVRRMVLYPSLFHIVTTQEICTGNTILSGAKAIYPSKGIPVGMVQHHTSLRLIAGEPFLVVITMQRFKHHRRIFLILVPLQMP
jgi:hypothetical protein